MMFWRKQKEKRKEYFYEPKPDITTFELAQLAPLMVPVYWKSTLDRIYDELPPECKRHIWVKID